MALGNMTDWNNRIPAYADQAMVSQNVGGSLLDWQIANPTTVQQNQEAGKWILPGVNDALAARQKNLADLQAQADKLTPASGTADTISGNLDQLAKLNNMSVADLTALVNEGYGSNKDLVTKGYSGMQADTAGVYGKLGTDVGSAYDTAALNSGNAYTDMAKTVEQMRPGSEAAAAQAARSFAPAAAATASTLRKYGIDPNSPEGAAAMRSVDVNKARAMDEQLASGTQAYVAAKIGLTKDQLTTQTGLALNKLAAQSGLSVDALSAKTGMAKEELGSLVSLGAQKTAQLMGVSDAAYTRSADWLSQSNNLATLTRAMEQQDYATAKDLLQGKSDEELTALDLQLKQYQLGQGFTNDASSTLNAQIGQLLGLSTDQYNRALQAAQVAQGWGGQGANAAGTTYGIASQNAGWGLKGIMGAVGAAAGPVAKVIARKP
jgi:hypothetical protein